MSWDDLSHMSYGVVIWGMANQIYRNKLQLLQNKIIKNIYASNNLSIYKRKGLLRFMDSSNYFAAIKLYKEINNSVVPYFSNKIWCLQINHNYPTRFLANHNIVPPRFRKSKCQSSFIYQSISFWNILPVEIKLSNNVKQFKQKLKSFIVSTYQEDS